MSPFDAYQIFLALKNHFNSDYDYFLYNGKVTAKYETFNKRPDKYYFHKLSKKKDVEGFIVANLLQDNSKSRWVGDIITKEGEEVYLKWKGRLESLSYIYKNDINRLDGSLDNILEPIEGNYPPLLQHYKFGDICIETIIVLNSLVNFMPRWSKKITDPLIWPEQKRKIEKYTPFLHFDRQKMKTLTIERFRQ